jgi:hypothetical protein
MAVAGAGVVGGFEPTGHPGHQPARTEKGVEPSMKNVAGIVAVALWKISIASPIKHITSNIPALPE